MKHKRTRNTELKIFLLLSCCILIASCSTVKSSKEHHNFINYQFDYDYYVSDVLELKKVTGNMNPSFVFPTIPGAIFGNPSKDILYWSEPNKSKKIRLSLPVNVSHKATLLNQNGIDIYPEDTRILRLGTFHIDPDEPRTLGGGGFFNTDTNNLLILVYVSKPSEISGTVMLGKTKVFHKINFDSPGWNWIEVKKLEGNNYQLERFTGSVSSIEFTILVPPLKSNSV